MVLVALSLVLLANQLLALQSAHLSAHLVAHKLKNYYPQVEMYSDSYKLSLVGV